MLYIILVKDGEITKESAAKHLNITPEEFEKVKVYIIAPEIANIKRNKVSLKYEDKIQMYSINNASFVNLLD